MGNQESISAKATLATSRLALTLAAAIIALAGPCAAQAQQGTSLADAARQARAQKGQNGDASQAQSKAQQTANQLSDDQNDQSAPRTLQNVATPAQASVPASPAPAITVANPPASTIPAGFKVHAFNYCKSRTECWNASVLVPADAQVVSSSCKQSAFETKAQATTFLLMAGPAAPECDGNDGPDQVRWKQLVDPENKRAPGTYSLVSSLNTSVAGKPAVVTTMTFRKGLDSWMGKRTELENNGVPLVVGCMAPRDHFADGDSICSKMMESLVLP